MRGTTQFFSCTDELVMITTHINHQSCMIIIRMNDLNDLMMIDAGWGVNLAMNDQLEEIFWCSSCICAS